MGFGPAMYIGVLVPAERMRTPPNGTALRLLVRRASSEYELSDSSSTVYCACTVVLHALTYSWYLISCNLREPVHM